MEEISKTRMILANRNLERRAAKIESVPCFKGIPATAFDKEHLVMLCSVFAKEWHKAQAQYFAALNNIFPSYMAGAEAVAKVFSEPSMWSKIWNRLKKLRPKVSSTPGSAHARTKTNAKV